MKQKSTLRSFLAIAGSSLLTITYASAGTYYWDSDGNATLGFGATAGDWNATPNANTKWSTSPTGDGIGGTAQTDYDTTDADDLFFGTGLNLTSAATTISDATVTCDSTANLKVGMTVTGTGIPASTTVFSITDSTTFELSLNATATNTGLTLSATFPLSGATTITGTVNANYVYQQSAHPNFLGTTPTINFSATGTYESSNQNRGFPVGTIITGAGTSLRWKSIRNLSLTGVTSNAAKTILSTATESTFSYPGRTIVTSASSLGPVGAGLEFDGATLRMSTGFPYASLSALNADHPVTFILNKNSGLDNSAGGTFTVDQAIDLGSGKFYAEGAGGGIIKLTQANTWAGTHITSAVLEISDSSHLGAITSPFTFGTGTTELASGNLRIAGTTMTSLGARPLFTTPTKTVGFDIVAAANTFTVDKELDQTTGAFTKAGLGTLVLIQDNTYTGGSTITGGGTLVLDYTTENGSKLSDTVNALTLTNGDLTLKNGSHPETVFSTALNAGHSYIARDGGTSTINLNAVTRAYGGTTSFSAAGIATTDTNNFGASGINGILGGWATIGDDWAVSANTGAANTAITALASYTPYVNTGGVATTNYLLNGDGTVAAATNAVGSLKITNSANSQSLALGANILNITSTNGTTLGGILYAGGNDNLYSITGTGRIQTSGGNQEIIFAVNTGTLTVACSVGPASGSTSPVTKSGAGKLVLTNASTTGGQTRVNQGTLLVNNTSGNGTGSGAVTVFNKAKLGGTGMIGGSTTINDGGGLTFDLMTPAGSHDKLDLAAGKGLTFPTAASGGSTTLTITSTGGTPAAGVYTLVTAPGQAQVETATAAGAVTVSGNATVTVTSAILVGSPLAISVPVVASDNASAIALAIRTALAANVDVAAKFDVTGAAASVVLTVKTAFIAGNDATLNIAIANGTSSGVTAAASSANTTAGVATITGSVPSTVVLPVGWTAGAPYIDGTSLKINITSVGAAGYAAWKGANAGGQDPDLDFDNDGVDNGVEYFMNAAAGFTASPALDGTSTITWPNGGNILPGAYGTQFVIQTSSDLSTWADVLVGDLTTNTPGPGGSLTYTLTGASPRFVRLKVTPN